MSLLAREAIRLHAHGLEKKQNQLAVALTPVTHLPSTLVSATHPVCSYLCFSLLASELTVSLTVLLPPS